MRRLSGVVLCLALGGGAAASAQDTVDVSALFGQAQNLFNAAGNKQASWDDARAALQQVIDAAPTHFEAHWLMASAYEREANKGQSHDWFVKCSDLAPDHFLAAWNAATGFSRYQLWEKSLTYLDRAEAARAAGTRGIPDHEPEKFFEVADFAAPAGRANALWELGRKDAVYQMAAARVAESPFYPAFAWYLGQQAEAAGNNEQAIAWYQKGMRQFEDALLPRFSKDGEKAKENAEKWWSGLLSGVNRHFGLDDRTTDTVRRFDYLKRYENWVAMQKPKYGAVSETPRAHQRFTDPDTELVIDLPHPKLMRLKKDVRYPWVFWFQIEHKPAAAGSVNTHVIDVLWHADDLQDALVLLRVNAGPFNINMNLQSGGTAKWVEPERLAEGLLKDATKVHFVEVANVQQPRKARFGRYQGFEFSFEGKEAQAVTAYKNAVAQQVKDPKPPPVWEVHEYVTKGKKFTWTLEFKCQKGQWKERQKDIQLLLKHIQFPG